MSKVETAFEYHGRTYFTELAATEIPVAGDMVHLSGDERPPRGALVVAQVSRSYDLDQGALTFVHVTLKTG